MKRHPYLAVFVVLASSLAACSLPGYLFEEQPAAVTDTPRVAQPTSPPPPLTLDELQNASYRLEMTEKETITLQGGTYAAQGTGGGETALTISLVQPRASGDLDGDGVEDAAVLLSSQPPGSGTFLSLHVLINEGGQPRHRAGLLLGDRVRIKSLAIRGEEIEAIMITHGPEDPLCCPTQIVEKTFQLEGKSLRETGSRVMGSVQENATAVPTQIAPLFARTWNWQAFVSPLEGESITVENPRNYTLELLPDGRYRVTSDCNVGQGTFTIQGKGITFEPDPSSIENCGENSLSSRYLKALSSVVAYDFKGEKLHLVHNMGEGSMIFTSDG